MNNSFLKSMHPSLSMANSNNFWLTEFISLLTKYLLAEGHEVYQSKNDADTLIVQHALRIAQASVSAVVVADDTEILVLLMYHYCKEEMADIFLRSEATKWSKAGLRIYSICMAVDYTEEYLVKNLLFLHAWSGCDTTSAIFGYGKGTVVKLTKKSLKFRNNSSIFEKDEAELGDIERAGQKLMALMYGGKEDDNLSNLRYAKYMNQLSISTSKLRPEILPPTNRAASFHSLRVYLQVYFWRHLSTDGLDPECWGWKKVQERFEPIMSNNDLAPPDILNVIRCKCKSSSKNQCGTNICLCKRNRLHCVAACQECRDCECINSSESNEEEYGDFERNAFDIFDD